eukprot:TRINITY_DN1785_c0_g1_i1.p1 TRINITY_DN1785_c0_g1~~TRINITY_DN1785_c0_g1_i1.p1  ORF type:complete len:165 (-),score=41.31 TRINITY_DN1785_c0_g1_i1:29-502(-)
MSWEEYQKNNHVELIDIPFNWKGGLFYYLNKKNKEVKTFYGKLTETKKSISLYEDLQMQKPHTPKSKQKTVSVDSCKIQKNEGEQITTPMKGNNINNQSDNLDKLSTQFSTRLQMNDQPSLRSSKYLLFHHILSQFPNLTDNQLEDIFNYILSQSKK